MVKAIAGFERALVSMRSPYDRYHFDRDDAAISESAKRGEILFHSRPLSCFTCHGGVHFSGAMGAQPATAVPFHNTGLYNLAGPLSYPASDTGLHRETGVATDIGRFKAPTLRNIAVTAPYMHDGSVATLGDVIDHYADGGRTIATGRTAASATTTRTRATACAASGSCRSSAPTSSPFSSRSPTRRCCVIRASPIRGRSAARLATLLRAALPARARGGWHLYAFGTAHRLSIGPVLKSKRSTSPTVPIALRPTAPPGSSQAVLPVSTSRPEPPADTMPIGLRTTRSEG